MCCWLVRGGQGSNIQVTSQVIHFQVGEQYQYIQFGCVVILCLQSMYIHTLLFKLKYFSIFLIRKMCWHKFPYLKCFLLLKKDNKIKINSHIQPDNSSKITLIKIHCTVIIRKIKISFAGYNTKSN